MSCKCKSCKCEKPAVENDENDSMETIKESIKTFVGILIENKVMFTMRDIYHNTFFSGMHDKSYENMKKVLKEIICDFVEDPENGYVISPIKSKIIEGNRTFLFRPAEKDPADYPLENAECFLGYVESALAEYSNDDNEDEEPSEADDDVDVDDEEFPSPPEDDDEYCDDDDADDDDDDDDEEFPSPPEDDEDDDDEDDESIPNNRYSHIDDDIYSEQDEEKSESDDDYVETDDWQKLTTIYADKAGRVSIPKNLIDVIKSSYNKVTNKPSEEPDGVLVDYFVLTEDDDDQIEPIIELSLITLREDEAPEDFENELTHFACFNKNGGIRVSTRKHFSQLNYIPEKFDVCLDFQNNVLILRESIDS